MRADACFGNRDALHSSILRVLGMSVKVESGREAECFRRHYDEGICGGGSVYAVYHGTASTRMKLIYLSIKSFKFTTASVHHGTRTSNPISPPNRTDHQLQITRQLSAPFPSLHSSMAPKRQRSSNGHHRRATHLQASRFLLLLVLL